MKLLAPLFASAERPGKTARSQTTTSTNSMLTHAKLIYLYY